MKQGWEIKKLGEVCDFQGGSQPPKDEWITEPRDGYVRMLQIRDFTQSRSFDIEYVKESNRLKYCEEEDILLGRYGASVGKVLTGLSGAYNVAIMKTMPNEELRKVYFRYFLQSPCFQKFLQQASTMRAAQAGFSKEDIQDFPIPVPPLPEQEKIVSELDCLSGIIEKKRQQLKELDALAQSIFYEMFGNPVDNEKGWEVKKLSNMCENLDYQRRPITAKDRISGYIPYYGASGVVDYVRDYIFDGDFLLVSEDGANLQVRHTPIAFSITGKTWVNNHAHILRFENFCTQRFMEFYINLSDISDIVRGCAQPKLTQASLNNILVFDIPLPLQQSFAQKIEAIEQQKALIKQSIAEVETLFNARMQEYFE